MLKYGQHYVDKGAELSFAKTLQGHKISSRNNVTGLSAWYSFQRHSGFWRRTGVGERWVGSCRRDLLDHIIAVDERHLKRLLSEYIRYYHEDRTHLGLGKGTPDGRTRTVASGHVLSHMRLGGLHHRYDRAA
jgi:hypothetical protein